MRKTEKINNRNLTFDILRIIAILAVVLIHTTSKSIELSGFDLIKVSFIFYINQLSRFAVPLFFLISGFVLALRYQKKLELKKYFKRRVSKLAIPYVFWSLIYFITLNEKGFNEVFSNDFLNNILLGTAWIQFYFIPSLILIYVIFPFLHKFTYILNSKTYFTLFTMFSLGLVIYDYNISFLTIPAPLRIAGLNFYLFVLGMVLKNKESEIYSVVKRYWKLILATLIFSMAIIIFESQKFYYGTLNVNFVTSQWRLSVFIYCIFIFLLSMYFLKDKLNKHSKIILRLSNLTFFVFFVHPIFISVFWKFFGSYFFSLSMGNIVGNVWFNLFEFIFVTSSSFLVAYILSFIPKTKLIFGIS